MKSLRQMGAYLMTGALVSSVAPRAFADDGAAPTTAAPRTATAAPVTVILHADTPRATIEKRASLETYAGLPLKDASLFGVATWTPECTAPCERPLDPSFTYRVAGDGLVPSDSFVLPHDGGPVVMDAKMGSAFGRLGGIGLSAVGAGGIILGATAMAVTPILADDHVGTPAVRTGVLASGVAVTALSAIVFGAGVWLWTHNETTVRADATRGFVF